MVETSVSTRGNSQFSTLTSQKKQEPVFLSRIAKSTIVRISTGFRELDRVLGGGLVEGHVVLIAGEPGIGKSTLILQVGAKFTQSQTTQFSDTTPVSTVLYVCGEESPSQIKLRAERLGIASTNILLYSEINVEKVLEEISKLNTRYPISNMPLKAPRLTSGRDSPQEDKYLVIVDSIQALYSDELTGIPGSVGQVRLCSQKLIATCKSLGMPLLLIGQITKEGMIAGPKVLEHAVDTVLYFEGERMEEVRLLRCLKNRFGTVDELAVLRMGEKGLEEIADASGLFIADGVAMQPGAVLCPIIAGQRILLVEIQSIVVPTKLAIARRVAQGFPRARLEMISAVLQKHLRLPLYQFDIFLNVSGGLAIEDPGADLAAALAIYSSLKNKALPVKACAFGELSLLAGIRSPLQQKKREEEAKRLGLKHIYSSDVADYLPELTNKIFIRGK